MRGFPGIHVFLKLALLIGTIFGQPVQNGDNIHVEDECQEGACRLTPYVREIYDAAGFVQRTISVPTKQLWELCAPSVPFNMTADKIEGCDEAECRFRKLNFLDAAGKIYTTFLETQFKELNATQDIKTCGTGDITSEEVNTFLQILPQLGELSVNKRSPQDGNEEYFNYQYDGGDVGVRLRRSPQEEYEYYEEDVEKRAKRSPQEGNEEYFNYQYDGGDVGLRARRSPQEEYNGPSYQIDEENVKTVLRLLCVASVIDSALTDCAVRSGY